MKTPWKGQLISDDRDEKEAYLDVDVVDDENVDDENDDEDNLKVHCNGLVREVCKITLMLMIRMMIL